MRRNTDAENAFGDVMPAATVHIRPKHGGGDSYRQPALQISNFEDIAYSVGSYSRTMMMCATTDNTVTTACWISVPASSVVAIQVNAVYALSAAAGTHAGSGGFIQRTACVVSSGARSQMVGQASNFGVAAAALSLTGNAAFNVTIGTGTGIITTGNFVPVEVTGDTSQKVSWLLDIETWTMYAQHIPGSTDTSSR